MVHHITPASKDKNFGKAINELIEYLPDDDWVALRDIDTLPVNHIAYIEQCENIANKNKFDLVSCITNRLGLSYQLHDEKISDNFDLKHHITIANERYKKYGSEVTEIKKTIAGVLMLFPKRTWEDVGRFPEGGIQVDGSFLDHIFCKRVQRIKGRIGIAKGIYLFHLYRHWEKNVRMGYSHLV